MVASEHPDDFETLASRRIDADRSLVVHLVADPESAAATTGLDRLRTHLDVAATAVERVPVTAPGEGYRFLETASAGSVLVVEQRETDVPEGAWGALVSLFATARYRRVHVVLVAPAAPTLVRRGVNVSVEPDAEEFQVALLEPAEEDPERTQEIDLGTL
jgi:hypothetical protein